MPTKPPATPGNTAAPIGLLSTAVAGARRDGAAEHGCCWLMGYTGPPEYAEEEESQLLRELTRLAIVDRVLRVDGTEKQADDDDDDRLLIRPPGSNDLLQLGAVVETVVRGAAAIPDSDVVVVVAGLVVGRLFLLTTGSDAELDPLLWMQYDSWPLGDATRLNLSEIGACAEALGRWMGAVSVDFFAAVVGTGSDVFPEVRDTAGVCFVFSDCGWTDDGGGLVTCGPLVSAVRTTVSADDLAAVTGSGLVVEGRGDVVAVVDMGGDAS